MRIQGENTPPPYTPMHRKVTSFNNKEFEVIYRHLTTDYNMYTSVMMEDAYRLRHFPLKTGMNAIDLGAHVGTVSLMLASMGVNVYSVEILPENIEIFEFNTLKNGYNELIKIYHRAIASVSNRMVKALYLDDAEGDAVSLCNHFDGCTKDGGQKFGKSIDVKTITIEDVFRENNLERCHILKTDVEGAEWDAFKDVPDDILQRIDVILGEVHYEKIGDPVDNSSLLPLFRGFFENASMIYQEMYPSLYHCPCGEVGPLSNFIYIRKGLPIPIRW
ncbi:FkbM family methyltransferase [Candidatus Bathyarchaeota archaeon]|nr:FkbM family methyltransferase [Candidatus Bathyarchaeota archaeon]